MINQIKSLEEYDLLDLTYQDSFKEYGKKVSDRTARQYQKKIKPKLDEVNRKRIDNIISKFESKLKDVNNDTVFDEIIEYIDNDISVNYGQYYKTGEIDDYIHEKLSFWMQARNVTSFGRGLLYQQQNIIDNIHSFIRNSDQKAVKDELMYIKAKSLKFNELSELYPDLVSKNLFESVNEFSDRISKHLQTMAFTGQLKETDLIEIETGHQSSNIQAKVTANLIDNQISQENKLKSPQMKLNSHLNLINGIINGTSGETGGFPTGGLRNIIMNLESAHNDYHATENLETKQKAKNKRDLLENSIMQYTDTHGEQLSLAIDNYNKILRSGKLNEDQFNHYIFKLNDVINSKYFTGMIDTPINLITDNVYGFGVPIETHIINKGLKNTSVSDWVNDILDPAYNPNKSLDTLNYNNHKIKKKQIKNNQVKVDTTKTDSTVGNEKSSNLDYETIVNMLSNDPNLKKSLGVNNKPNPMSNIFQISLPEMSGLGFDDFLSNIEWNDDYTGIYSGGLPVKDKTASYLHEEFGRKVSGLDGNNFVTPGDNMISNMKNLRMYELYNQKDPQDSYNNKINEYKEKLKVNYNNALDGALEDKLYNIGKTQEAYNMIMNLYDNPGLSSKYIKRGINVNMSKADIAAFNDYLNTGNVLDGWSKENAFNNLRKVSENIGGWGYKFDSSVFPTEW